MVGAGFGFGVGVRVRDLGLGLVLPAQLLASEFGFRTLLERVWQ
jgi:hypothetical protein